MPDLTSPTRSFWGKHGIYAYRRIVTLASIGPRAAAAVASHGLLGDRFLIPDPCGVLDRPKQPLRSIRATRTSVVAHHHDRLRGLRAGDRGEPPPRRARV